MARVAVLSDVHGNEAALAAVRKAIAKERPEAILVAGDLVMNGPEPGPALDGIREMEAAGAIVVQGNTDVAVADFDYAAAFPWYTDGVPEHVRAATEWAHETIDGDGLEYLRRLPAERRLWVDDVMILLCHASPGSQTAGLADDLDAAATLERISRTDARVICCGHTHVPSIRDLGWRIIVNDGSAGYVFDGDASASWALLTIEGEEVTAEIRRVGFDTLAVSDAITARGLPGDVYRAATVRTGKFVR
jgi:putative phosphoesterase